MIDWHSRSPRPNLTDKVLAAMPYKIPVDQCNDLNTIQPRAG